MPNVKKVVDEESLDCWPYPVPSLSPSDISRAINDADWQKFRLSLKGWPTGIKLAKLKTYLNGLGDIDNEKLLEEQMLRDIRVANYINALRRGGQLDLNNRVQR